MFRRAVANGICSLKCRELAHRMVKVYLNNFPKLYSLNIKLTGIKSRNTKILEREPLPPDGLKLQAVFLSLAKISQDTNVQKNSPHVSARRILESHFGANLIFSREDTEPIVC